MSDIRSAINELGVLGESLSEEDLILLEQRVFVQQRKKSTAGWLHLIGVFWAPLYYLGRPVAGTLFLIGTVAFMVLLTPQAGADLGAIGGLSLITYLIVWLLGFGYLRRAANKHNAGVPKAVLNEYAAWRLGFNAE